MVALEGDTIRILDVGGIGTHITWIVSVSDASGNPAEAECEVQVIKPKSN